MLKPNHTTLDNIKIIVCAWLISGSLDILSAVTDYYIKTGKGPGDILKYVASGVFGKEAFDDSDIMIWAGLLFHFIIAFIFTLLFFILYPRVKLLQLNVFITAIIFGMIVWAIMNLIVVPLSNTPRPASGQRHIIKPLLILICMIGLPLSIIYKRYFRSYVSTYTI